MNKQELVVLQNSTVLTLVSEMMRDVIIIIYSMNKNLYDEYFDFY